MSSTRTASPTPRSRASSVRASIASWTSCRRARPARSSAGSCAPKKWRRERVFREPPGSPDPSPRSRAGDRRVSDHDGFRVERDDGVATITLDVPGKLNRVSMVARGQLADVFAQLGRDEEIRAVVLRGAGEAFTAGGDIAGFLEREPEELSRLAWNVAAAERCPKPVIARLRGYALGVGLELALACDFRIAADDAELGLPEIRLGMIPGSGGTQRVARLAGLGRAKDMIMRGRRVKAAEALAPRRLREG